MNDQHCEVKETHQTVQGQGCEGLTKHGLQPKLTRWEKRALPAGHKSGLYESVAI